MGHQPDRQPAHRALLRTGQRRAAPAAGAAAAESSAEDLHHAVHAHRDDDHHHLHTIPAGQLGAPSDRTYASPAAGRDGRRSRRGGSRPVGRRLAGRHGKALPSLCQPLDIRWGSARDSGPSDADETQNRCCVQRRRRSRRRHRDRARLGPRPSCDRCAGQAAGRGSHTGDSSDSSRLSSRQARRGGVRSSAKRRKAPRGCALVEGERRTRGHLRGGPGSRAGHEGERSGGCSAWSGVARRADLAHERRASRFRKRAREPGQDSHERRGEPVLRREDAFERWPRRGRRTSR